MYIYLYVYIHQPTSPDRHVRAPLHFSYLISHIAYCILAISQSHKLTISYSHISYLASYYLGWSSRGGGGHFYPHRRIYLNCALSSLCHTYYTILYYTILTILTTLTILIILTILTILRGCLYI